MNKFILSSMPKMPSILFTVPTLIVMTWNVNFVYFLFLKADKIFDIFSKFQLLHCKNFTVKYIDLGGVCFVSDAKNGTSKLENKDLDVQTE